MTTMETPQGFVAETLASITSVEGVLVLFGIAIVCICGILGCCCGKLRSRYQVYKFRRAREHHRIQGRREGRIPIATLRAAYAETFVCVYNGCGRAFPSSSDLRKHQRERGHEVGDDRPYECHHPGCGRRFAARDAMKAHQASAGHEPRSARHSPRVSDSGGERDAKLYVKMVGLHGMRSIDRDRSMYCVLTKGEKVRRTKVVSRDNRPQWKELFSFAGTHSTLEVVLMESDDIGDDTFIGDIKIPVATIAPKSERSYEGFFKCKNRSGKAVAQFHMIFYWTLDAQAPVPQLAAKKSAPGKDKSRRGQHSGGSSKRHSMRRVTPPAHDVTPADDPFDCPHAGCGKRYPSFALLESHVRLRHADSNNMAVDDGTPADPGPYTCDICGDESPSYDMLVSHVQLRHSGAVPPVNKKYRCEECGKRYETTALLDKHKQLRHDASVQRQYGQLPAPPVPAALSKPHACDECGKSYETQELLDHHFALRHVADNDSDGDEAIAIQYGNINDVVPRVQAAVAVADSAESNAFPCEYCEKSYPTAVLLSHHMTLRHPDKGGHYEKLPEKPTFQCQHCDNAYLTSLDLIDHIRKRHADESNEVSEQDVDSLSLDF